MEWKISPGLTPYPHALTEMAARVTAIQRGEAEELVWLVEHPPLYTAGTSAKGSDLLQPADAGGDAGSTMNHCAPSALPVFETGRGGQYTYHGPGQRVAYLMLDLKKRARAKGGEPDLRAYVKQLEQWIIVTLAEFGIHGFTREGRVGVWVEERVSGIGYRVSETAGAMCEASPEPRAPSPEKKIAALGVRVQKWVTSHGIAINLNPDLSHYAGIVPCGIREFGVTSLHQMGRATTMEELDAALKKNFTRVFGAQD